MKIVSLRLCEQLFESPSAVFAAAAQSSDATRMAIQLCSPMLTSLELSEVERLTSNAGNPTVRSSEVVVRSFLQATAEE
jgi:hypothetical protein